MRVTRGHSRSRDKDGGHIMNTFIRTNQHKKEQHKNSNIQPKRYTKSTAEHCVINTVLIRSAISKNPLLHANFKALCFIKSLQLPIEVLHCENRDFRPFWLLGPWPWPDDLHLRNWPVSPRHTPYVRKWIPYVEAFESYRIAERQADKQTDIRHRNYIPRGFTAGQH